MSNSAGNTNRDVRKFLRDHGIKASASNVELIGREVRRTMAQNEAVDKMHKELGTGLRDRKGRDAREVAKARVKRKLKERGED